MDVGEVIQRMSKNHLYEISKLCLYDLCSMLFLHAAFCSTVVEIIVETEKGKQQMKQYLFVEL